MWYNRNFITCPAGSCLRKVMPFGEKGSGLENCIPLYFIHFYKTTDPVRHNFLRLDPFLILKMFLVCVNELTIHLTRTRKYCSGKRCADSVCELQKPDRPDSFLPEYHHRLQMRCGHSTESSSRSFRSVVSRRPTRGLH